VDKRFGAKAKVGAKTPKLTIDGVAVENYFSPVDDVMKKLVAEVNRAQKSVKFIIFTYTHPDLSSAMIARAKAGIKVEGVIENLAATQGALVPLFCARVLVRTDGNKYTMHHKVIIIDGTTVITGSFNFTKSADDSNDDNILIIRSPAVAALYEQEEARRYAEGKMPDSAKLTCK
jgi:phosphatidylserine/phosphatidylglycerophosphate/cardiolipin synthase-like enzyme